MSVEGGWLEDVCGAVRNDREVVLTAVARDGRSLNYTSREHQEDAEVVLAAVMCDGLALQLASPRLSADEWIVVAAVRNDIDALAFASPSARQNKTLFFKIFAEEDGEGF